MTLQTCCAQQRAQSCGQRHGPSTAHSNTKHSPLVSQCVGGGARTVIRQVERTAVACTARVYSVTFCTVPDVSTDASRLNASPSCTRLGV